MSSPSGMSVEQKTAAASAHVAHSAARVEQSAGALKTSARELTDSADRRTDLAVVRTGLAAERTYAAWIRTGLAAMASGVGAGTLTGNLLPDWVGVLVGSVLLLFSVLCFGAAGWRTHRPAPEGESGLPFPRLVLVLVNGSLIVLAAALLVGLWWSVAAG